MKHTINAVSDRGVQYKITGNAYTLPFYDNVKLRVLVNKQGNDLHLTDYLSGRKIANIRSATYLNYKYQTSEREKALTTLNKVIFKWGIERVKAVIYDRKIINLGVK